MQLVIDPQGQARCVYSESIDLAALGDLTIRRGSNVNRMKTASGLPTSVPLADLALALSRNAATHWPLSKPGCSSMAFGSPEPVISQLQPFHISLAPPLAGGYAALRPETDPENTTHEAGFPVVPLVRRWLPSSAAHQATTAPHLWSFLRGFSSGPARPDRCRGGL